MNVADVRRRLRARLDDLTGTDASRASEKLSTKGLSQPNPHVARRLGAERGARDEREEAPRRPRVPPAIQFSLERGLGWPRASVGRTLPGMGPFFQERSAPDPTVEPLMRDDADVR